MKRLLAFVLCVFTLLLVGCDTPSEQMAEEDIRKSIAADNGCINETDDVAGAAWLLRYLNVENAEMVELFRTSDMSEGFDLCFSKWSAGQREYIVSEVVYEDGSRYLCDLYELTGVTELRTLKYAYDRISGDERFADGMKGIGSNAFSEGVKEVNITSQSVQTLNNTLLAEESVAAGQVLYGVPSDGSNYTVKVVVTVDGSGIRNIYMCNDDRPADNSEGQTVLNRTYYIGFSSKTDDFILMDRLNNEQVIYDTVDTEDETRRMPELYGVWEDRIAVYTVSDNNGIVSVGVYDAAKKTNVVRPSSGVPIGIYGGRLYLSKVEADGSCTVAYIPLDDLNAESVLFDGREGKIDNVAFSSDGRMAALYTPVDGRTTVCIFDAMSGELIDEEYIEGVYCEPRYVGFLEDGSLMVLCDEKLLCDEYLFIIGE